MKRRPSDEHQTKLDRKRCLNGFARLNGEGVSPLPSPRCGRGTGSPDCLNFVRLPGSTDLVESCTLLTALACTQYWRALLATSTECDFAAGHFGTQRFSANPARSCSVKYISPACDRLLPLCFALACCSLHTARMSSTPALPDIGSIVFISTKPLIKFVDPRTPLRMRRGNGERQLALTRRLARSRTGSSSRLAVASGWPNASCFPWQQLEAVGSSFSMSFFRLFSSTRSSSLSTMTMSAPLVRLSWSELSTSSLASP